MNAPIRGEKHAITQIFDILEGNKVGEVNRKDGNEVINKGKDVRRCLEVGFLAKHLIFKELEEIFALLKLLDGHAFLHKRAKQQ